MLYQVLVVVVAIVGKRYNSDASSWVEVACDLEIAWIHEFDQVFHDDVDAVFVEIALVAEAEEVELEALALDHALTWNEANHNASEVGLSCNGTQGCELWAVESDDVLVVGVQILEGFEHLGVILVAVGSALVSKQCDAAGGVFVA